MKTTIRTQRKQLLNGLCYTLVFVLLFASCDGPSGPPKPVDPCEGRKTPFKAGFTIYEGSPNIDTIVASDTILYIENWKMGVGTFALFRADGDYTSYEWKVGDDPRTFTRKEFTLKFNEKEFIGTYRVRLIARDTNWAKCVSGDDGIDTVYRTLTVVPALQAKIFGKYRGVALHNPTDTFTVELRMQQIEFPSQGDSVALLFNFPNGGQPIRYEGFPTGDTIVMPHMDLLILNRAMYIEAHGISFGANQAEGTGTLSPDGNILTIRYSEIDPKIRNRVYGRQFIGQRIN